MADVELLKELAGYAGVAGLPWADLDAQGKGFLESEEYVRLLTFKRMEFDQLRQTLIITNDEYGPATSAEVAAVAWDSLHRELTRFGETYVDGLMRGETSVAENLAVTVRTSVLRTLIVIINAVTTDADAFHASGMAFTAVASGALPLELAKRDASDTYALWNAALLLDKWDMLDALKVEGATQGLGQWQRALVSSITLLGVIAVLAYASYKVWEFSVRTLERVHWAKVSCYDDAGKPLAPQPPGCDLYFQNLGAGAAPSSGFADFLDQLGKKIGTGLAWALGIGVLVYVTGVYVLPAGARPMIYSRWDPTTGLYDYFESSERVGINDDLPVPKMPSAPSPIGVPSVECGREMPPDAVHIGQGEQARGLIAPPPGVALMESTSDDKSRESAAAWFLAGVGATLGFVWMWMMSRRGRPRR